jgi:hypothetical protein
MYVKEIKENIAYMAFELQHFYNEVFVYFYCNNHFPCKNSQTEDVYGRNSFEIIKFFQFPFDYNQILKFAKTLAILN